MKTIVQKEDPVLRENAEEVPLEEIGSVQVQKTISEMKDALASERDGVAIAAPQIGVSQRIFVVAGNIFSGDEKTAGPDMTFINPRIVERSQEMESLEEGCLSVRGKYGEVERHMRVKLAAHNEDGEEIVLEAKGFLAQIFQHETDHLDGILFIDKATELVDIDVENEEENEE